MSKNVQTTTKLHSSHTLVKVVLKIFQVRLQQYINHELPDVQVGFRKRGTRDQIANIRWIIEKKQENSRKTFTSASFTMLKPLCRSQQTVESSSRHGNTR